jgi:hypothetical protein
MAKIVCPYCGNFLDEAFIKHARAVINGEKGGAPKGNSNKTGKLKPVAPGKKLGRPRKKPE